MKKTWAEKLADKKNFPKVLKLEKRFPCYNAVHKMGAEAGDDVVLANPSEIVAIMAGVPKGKVVTIVEICKALARKHKVKGCCSLTTGIFIMTAANAAEEVSRSGKKMRIPYWRTLKADGYLNEKYPGGQEGHKKLLEKEGHKIVRRGQRLQAADFKGRLWAMSRKRQASSSSCLPPGKASPANSRSSDSLSRINARTRRSS
jgi:alkylated DNA nucleotide flippase Atl1